MNVLIRLPVHGGGHRVVGSEHIASMRRASHAEGDGVVVVLSGGDQVHVVAPDDAPALAREEPLRWLQDQIDEAVQERLGQVAAEEAIRGHQAVDQLVGQLHSVVAG
ncbi:MAG TPA: hypothetical protein ENK18_16120 [Deltaproteobacteria bacterium]|nr:hypothetical protein [Deltaproteobacteria bacterium]